MFKMELMLLKFTVFTGSGSSEIRTDRQGDGQPHRDQMLQKTHWNRLSSGSVCACFPHILQCSSFRRTAWAWGDIRGFVIFSTKITETALKEPTGYVFLNQVKARQRSIPTIPVQHPARGTSKLSKAGKGTKHKGTSKRYQYSQATWLSVLVHEGFKSTLTEVAYTRLKWSSHPKSRIKVLSSAGAWGGSSSGS